MSHGSQIRRASSPSRCAVTRSRGIAAPFSCAVLALAFCSAIQPAVQAADSLDRTATQWAPYVEWSLKNDSFDGNPFDLVATATFVHKTSGKTHTTGMFHAGAGTWKFRFTGTRPGQWTFRTTSADPQLDGHHGTVTVKGNPKGYGFVTHVGNKWAQQRGVDGKPQVFVPQYAMYGHPGTYLGKPKKIETDIRTYLDRHGFTGFHTPVFCRWFDIKQDRAGGIKSKDPNPDPRTFKALELLITKVHARGGVVHLWAWGDEMRRQTSITWGINGKVDRRLQRYIAARLGPLPGWTMGYGFDLWEWVKGEQLTRWHKQMHAEMGWPHLLGARSERGRLRQLSEALDYASLEQHRPDYRKYVETIAHRPRKPSFSEDRFRVRQSSQYKFKDYTEETTRRGLWHSTMAGGVANIWGRLDGELQINMGIGQSRSYKNPHWIKTWSVFFADRFLADMNPDDSASDGACLRRADRSAYVFYREDCDTLRVDLSRLTGSSKAIAVDTKQSYAPRKLGELPKRQSTWKAPYRSDWALAVGDFPSP